MTERGSVGVAAGSSWFPSVGAMSRRLRVRKLQIHPVSLLVTAVAALAAVWIGAASDFGSTFEPLSGTNGLLYDLSIGLIGRLHAAAPWRNTAVILIDNRTLGSRSWASVPRALQQPQLGRLGLDILDAGARKVGYDLVLAFDPADLPPPFKLPEGYDGPLIRLLTDHADDVVLGTDVAVAPAQRYGALLGTANLGVIDVQTEADGKVRSVANRIRLPNGMRAFGLAAALANGAPEAASLFGSRTLIAPPAPVDTIPHITAAELNSCLDTSEGRRALRTFLADRIAIVGAGLVGEDEHSGPDRFLAKASSSSKGEFCAGRTDPTVSRKGGSVPGAFLQAAAVESMLTPHPLAVAPPGVRILANLLIVAGAVLLRIAVERTTRRFVRPRWFFGTTIIAGSILILSLVAAGAAVIGFAAAGILVAHLWIPLGPAATGMALLGSAQTVARTLRQDVTLADLRITFGRWLPAPVIAAALGGSRTPLHGEERIVSVLIADLVDFTAFCANHRANPERIVTALNRKFSAAQAVIDRYEGCVDKFMGDAVIAFWNGIEPQSDHAHRAMAAAAEIVQADRRDPDRVLGFRCAVATGVAFVGRYGSDQKSSFSAIGDPMNLAARLESLCRTHGLDTVVSHATVQSLMGAARKSPDQSPPSRQIRKIGQAKLKGFAEPQTFYTLDFGTDGSGYDETSLSNLGLTEDMA